MAAFNVAPTRCCALPGPTAAGLLLNDTRSSSTCRHPHLHIAQSRPAWRHESASVPPPAHTGSWRARWTGGSCGRERGDGTAPFRAGHAAPALPNQGLRWTKGPCVALHARVPRSPARRSLLEGAARVQKFLVAGAGARARAACAREGMPRGLQRPTPFFVYHALVPFFFPEHSPTPHLDAHASAGQSAPCFLIPHGPRAIAKTSEVKSVNQ